MYMVYKAIDVYSLTKESRRQVTIVKSRFNYNLL